MWLLELRITHVTHVMFLLDSAGLEFHTCFQPNVQIGPKTAIELNLG